MTGLVPDGDGHTPLTEDERDGLIPAHLVTRAELNQWEGLNIARAQRWLGLRRRTDVLTEKFARELHRKMFGETWRWAGAFRKSDNNISPHPWHSVPILMRDLLHNTRAQYDASDKGEATVDSIAARFHHMLVRIHPWPNGNGRHARLMTDVLLEQWGRPAFRWGGGRDLAHVGDARARYLHALQRADAGDPAALEEFCRS